LGGTLQSSSAISLDTNGIVVKGINSDRTCQTTVVNSEYNPFTGDVL